MNTWQWFALLWATVAVSGKSQDLPNELFLSVTYRDFLPAACLTRRKRDNNSGVSIVRNAWGLPDGELTSGVDRHCFKLLSNQRWNKAIENGVISGHPDFEAIGFFENQDKCEPTKLQNRDPATGLAFPVGSCIFNFGEKFSVVGRTMTVGENGIPKPNYCSDIDGGETRCGFTSKGQTQTQKKFFDLWYNDDETFNKRVGLRMRLRRKGDAAFAFNSSKDVSAVDFPNDSFPDFFGPLNMFKTGGSAEISLNVRPKDAPAWPQPSVRLTLRGKAFSMTTEVHTTFEFQSDANMTFTFSGDDDFWAYINGQLTVDVGGMHSFVQRTVDLNAQVNGRSIADELGLVDGEVYTLDIFHAERQSPGSNFALETTLFAACNVAQSGKPSFDFVEDDLEALTPKFITKGTTIENNKKIILQKSTDTFSSGIIFSKQEENTIRGFDATFSVTISRQNTIGFAFVIQSFGIDDFPLVSGESFNIDGLPKSLAVVFDLCTDRGSSGCKGQEVRLHHAANSTESNSPREDTRKVHDRILRNVKRDEKMPIQIIYFGGTPDFLEVYVNNSLYLRQDGFAKILEDLEIEGAHVGFTATSGNLAADITIEDFKLNTVQVDPPLTKFIEIENADQGVQVVLADGEEISEGVPIATFDFCTNQLEAGTLQDLVDGVYIQEIVSDQAARQESNITRNIERAFVVDNGDGTYQISLRTLIPGNYSLAVAFGDGCLVAVDSDGVPRLNESSPDDCFFDIFNNGKVLTVATPVAVVPTASPIEIDLNDNESQVILIAGVAGGLSLIGLCTLVVFVGFYRKWRRKKGYVDPGNMYRLDVTTAYQGNTEYTTTGKKLLDSQREILALQAAERLDGRKAEIKSLKDENDQMKEIIKKKKALIGVNVPSVSSGAPRNISRKKKPKRTEF